MSHRRRQRQWNLRFFHLRVMAIATAVTTGLVLVAGLFVYLFERGSDESNIRSLWDSVWFGLETITTVGYGDHHPTTVGGRLVATGLMVAGIAMVSLITATVVTWFFAELEWFKDVRELEEAEEHTEATLERLLEETRALHARLDQMERRIGEE